MMLYLLRHAHAEPGGQHDVERPLSVLGRDQAFLAGDMIKTLPAPPSQVLTSPYARAHETAAIIASTAGLPPPEICESLSLDSDQRHILATVNALPDVPLLLVGHEPHLREFASLLVTGNRQMRVRLGNATLVCLTVPRPAAWETATLEWVRDVDGA